VGAGAGGATGAATDYFYDGWRVLEERDGTTTATIRRQFVYGNYLDEALVMDVDTDSDGSCVDSGGSARYFYHQNTLYSVCAVTDSTGKIVEGYEYDPYGRHILLRDGPNATGGDQDTAVNFNSTDIRLAMGASAIGNPYTFTGQRFDPETGLQYSKERYYSCTQGRFISRDPIGYEGGTNVYCYVHNDPIDATDPMGLWKVTRHTKDYYAVAEATKDCDKVKDLADMIHLDVKEYEKWLTPLSGGLKDEYKKGETVLVPNTIYAAFNGHYGIAGRFVSHYNARVASYRIQGYKVYNDNGRPSSMAMKGMLASYWNGKSLYGFYYMGHGGTRVVIDKAGKPYASHTIAGSVRWWFKPSQLHDPGDPGLSDSEVIAIKAYGIAIVKIWACFSAEGQWRQVGSPNALDIDLKKGVYIPVVST